MPNAARCRVAFDPSGAERVFVPGVLAFAQALTNQFLESSWELGDGQAAPCHSAEQSQKHHKKSFGLGYWNCFHIAGIESVAWPVKGERQRYGEALLCVHNPWAE